MDLLPTSRNYNVMNFTTHYYPQPSLSFYDITEKSIRTDIWDALRAGLWKDYQIDNQLWNADIGATKQIIWKPIFPHIAPIYRGYKWDHERCSLIEDRYSPEIVPMDMDIFLARCEKYFSKFDGKRIAVHLSGGFDSSLIIGLLHHFGIPFYLIGLVSERFEFRTERRIQEILSSFGQKTILIDLRDYPFYSGLDCIPAKQFPDEAIKSNGSAKAIASVCRENGVDVILGGQGGDSLFVDAIPMPPDKISFNIGNEFDVSDERELIYAPEGIDIRSFYAEKSIIEGIYNLRIGEGLDATKWWARNFFKDFLPRELVEYNYTADFFGISMSGLEQAKPTIKLLFEKAYDLLKHPVFSPEGTREVMATNVFKFDYKMYINYCAKISIASWLNSLIENE